MLYAFLLFRSESVSASLSACDSSDGGCLPCRLQSARNRCSVRALGAVSDVGHCAKGSVALRNHFLVQRRTVRAGTTLHALGAVCIYAGCHYDSLP